MATVFPFPVRLLRFSQNQIANRVLPEQEPIFSWEVLFPLSRLIHVARYSQELTSHQFRQTLSR